MSRRRPSLAVDRSDVMDFLRQSPRPGAAEPDTAVPAPPQNSKASERSSAGRRIQPTPRKEPVQPPQREKREHSARVRATFQIDSSVLDKARDAVVALSPKGFTLTRLFEEALVREIGRLSKELNGGRPFPPRSVPPRVGRPVR